MDLAVIERKWQKRWSDVKVFEPVINEGRKFFFTVPFPYTSGAPHIGHGRTFTVGDFIARFKRKQGFNVLWPVGFHRSGTPILAISDKISKGDKATIDLFSEYVALKESDPVKVKRIVKSFKDPEVVADYFAGMLEDGFTEVGLSIDWSRKFKTGDVLFNKFIEWQYAKLMSFKALVQGSYPITYCVNCRNAVGEDDVKDGDTDEVSINEFTAIKFRLGDKSLIASTLRPETIYGVTNLWVNPDIVYVEALLGDELIIVSADAFSKLRFQHDNIRKVRDFPGSELIGKSVITPLGFQVPVLPGAFVNSSVASGIVYSVPAHAPFDYVALRDLRNDYDLISKFGLSLDLIKSIKPVIIIGSEASAIKAVEKSSVKSQLDKGLIDSLTKEVYKEEFYNGVLNDSCGKFKGLKVSSIKNQVSDELIRQGNAFIFFETSRPASCRCGGDVIIAVLNNQWFLNYSIPKWKSKTLGLINSLSVVPEKYRKSFIDTLEWLDKRPCARKRGIGTPLPYDNEWVIESLSDSTIYMAFYTIAGVLKEFKVGPEELTLEVLDFIFLGKGASSKAWVKRARQEFIYWYPLDHRHTAPAHISNHLSFFLFHHTAIFPKKCWPKALSFNEMVIRDGAKMSKSKGNIIPLANISRQYSADVFRLFVLSSSDIDSVVDWRETEVLSVKNKLINFLNNAFTACDSVPLSKFSSVDKWLLCRFYSRLNDALILGNKLKVRDYAVSLFFELTNELNHYRKRVSSEQFNSMLRFILPDWVVALEPLIPHACEEVWSRLGGEGFVSLQSFPKIKRKFINESFVAGEELIMQTVSDVNGLIKLVKFSPQKVSVFIADEWKYLLFDLIIKSGSKDFKVLSALALKHAEVKRNAKDAIKLIEALIKNPSRIPLITPVRDLEYKSLNEAIKFLEKEFNLEFDVIKASNPKALPGKPGILIE